MPAPVKIYAQVLEVEGSAAQWDKILLAALSADPSAQKFLVEGVRQIIVCTEAAGAVIARMKGDVIVHKCTLTRL